jgi:hypothetical protein
LSSSGSRAKPKDITTTLNLYARVRPGRSVELAARMDQLIGEGSSQPNGR